MSWLKSLFHRHTFDPKEWQEYKVISAIPQGDTIPTRKVYIWKNTCLTCGQLVFKKITVNT